MTTVPAVSSPSPFAVFHNRNFALMWTGQLVSTIGSALTSPAASIYIYHVTGSSAWSLVCLSIASIASRS